MATFTGKSQDASSVILGASFWQKGKKIEGTVVRPFNTANGICYEVSLKQPLQVGREMHKQVSVGALKGFQMALAAAGLDGLQRNDKIILQCTGAVDVGKGNPRIEFQIAVDRP